MLSNKRGCFTRINVGLDRMSIITLDWSMDDTQTLARTCRQACKDVKKQRKPNGCHKASKASISTSHKAEKGVNQAHQHHEGVSQKWKRMQPRKQVVSKTNKHKSTKGTKHGKASI